MSTSRESLGHLALCEELLGLFDQQRKALVEGRMDEAALLMAERASVIERMKPLTGVPPSDTERERVDAARELLAVRDSELQTIIRMRMNDLSSRMGTIGKTRDYAGSLTTGGLPATQRLDLKG